MNNSPITLRQFTTEIAHSIRSNPALSSRWVIAELSDVGVKGGHCYMELVEKDERGVTTARLRATIWANNFAYRIKPKFEQATGQPFKSGIKVMIYGSASFHEQYGLSFNITDINPSFTLGDIERIRREIIDSLTAEGVIENNKRLSMPTAPQRIAIVSADGAAGYGDFINQINNNPSGLKFYTHLFNAVMQGENTAPSVIEALDRIALTIDLWDCVVIIRGGGATSDLNGFDNLELARKVATFDLPIIVGIGHERDRTVLDEIAHTRVKTPTAAAEWLIDQAQSTFDKITSLANQIATYVNERVVGAKQQLSFIENAIPVASRQQLTNAKSRLSAIASALPHITSNKILSTNRKLEMFGRDIQNVTISRIAKAQTYLNVLSDSIKASAPKAIKDQSRQLQTLENIINALSPDNTLKRGFSITKINGKTMRSVNQISDNDKITTILADGEITSTVNKPTN